MHTHKTSISDIYNGLVVYCMEFPKQTISSADICPLVHNVLSSVKAVLSGYIICVVQMLSQVMIFVLKTAACRP